MIPPEFLPAAIAAASQPSDVLPYAAVVRSGEPYKSLQKSNYHLGSSGGLGVRSREKTAFASNPAPGLNLEDENLFYNTRGAAEKYWAGTRLPQPTRDLRRLRADLVEFGYALLADGMSKEQVAAVRERVYEQARNERKAGLASLDAGPPPPGQTVPPVQLVHSLLNKGDVFRRVMEFDPEAFQGGPVVEQILKECLGDGFLHSTFVCLIASQFNLPQYMHQDQVMAPFQTPLGPVSVNTMVFLDDFSAENGGTLVVPTSHRLVSSSEPGKMPPLPPPVAASGPAGTVLFFEGRLVHGTGVNRTRKPRAGLILDNRMHFLRQQELWLLSLAPDVIAKLKPRTLARLGFHPVGMGGAEGTFRGWQVEHRLAIAEGRYVPVRELRDGAGEEELERDYTWRHTDTGRRLGPHQMEATEGVRRRFANVAGRDPKL
ncbi:hypothetical protein DFJ74DRAFT_688203 [Hyaloraphidium curvatum]|nr:hypothetical protein DFJ74DRAFT_688203 [Hyaloraphidium curvatum]